MPCDVNATLSIHRNFATLQSRRIWPVWNFFKAMRAYILCLVRPDDICAHDRGTARYQTSMCDSFYDSRLLYKESETLHNRSRKFELERSEGGQKWHSVNILWIYKWDWLYHRYSVFSSDCFCNHLLGSLRNLLHFTAAYLFSNVEA